MPVNKQCMTGENAKRGLKYVLASVQRITQYSVPHKMVHFKVSDSPHRNNIAISYNLHIVSH